MRVILFHVSQTETYFLNKTFRVSNTKTFFCYFSIINFRTSRTWFFLLISVTLQGPAETSKHKQTTQKAYKHSYICIIVKACVNFASAKSLSGTQIRAENSWKMTRPRFQTFSFYRFSYAQLATLFFSAELYYEALHTYTFSAFVTNCRGVPPKLGQFILRDDLSLLVLGEQFAIVGDGRWSR